MQPTPGFPIERGKVSVAKILLTMMVVAIVAASLTSAKVPEEEQLPSLLDQSFLSAPGPTVAKGLEAEQLIPAILGGFMTGMTVAAIFLATREVSSGGVVAGLLLGAVVGPLIAVVILIPMSLLVIGGGSVVILGFAAAVRFFSSKPLEESDA